MIKTKLNALATSIIGMGLLAATTVFADDSALPSKPQAQSPAVKSVQPQVDSTVADQVAEKRREIADDAVAAINESVKALKFLEDKQPKKALESLEKATGKLELIVARDPELALVPVSVNITTHDLITSLDTIEEVVEEAEDYLDDDEVQKARRLLANLASEMVITTTQIPLATYPDAIKAITPLIDSGKIDEAAIALQAALNTLVITEEIIPLPVMRAGMILESAEVLAEDSKRSDKDNKLLADLLSAARYQLKMAEKLGYGDKDAFDPIYDQLDEIEDKASEGEGGKGWFDKIRKQLGELVK